MTARCTEPGCPVRWSHGSDRPCRDHRPDYSDTLTGRMTQFADVMATTPGEHDGGDEGQAADERRAVNRHGVPVL